MSREEANAKALGLMDTTTMNAALKKLGKYVDGDEETAAAAAAREAHIAYQARLRNTLVGDLNAEERAATLNDLPVMPMPTVEQLVGARDNARAAEEIRQAEANRRKRILDDIPNGVVTYRDLLLLQELGVIKNSLPEHVNGTSIDLTLGPLLLPECENYYTISLREREPLRTQRRDLRIPPSTHCPPTDRPWTFGLGPGRFLLAHSEQVFDLPDCISAEFKLKSSGARIGLEHLNAGWCDPGWNGSALTLELKNMTRKHRIILQTGDRIGQMVFYKHPPVPADRSYRVTGRYNNDPQVQGVKP